MNKALAISLYLESFPNAVGVVVSAMAKAQPFWLNAVIPLIAVLTSECPLASAALVYFETSQSFSQGAGNGDNYDCGAFGMVIFPPPSSLVRIKGYGSPAGSRSSLSRRSRGSRIRVARSG